MKKYLLFLVFIFGFSNAQNQRFTYEYRFMPDSTSKSDVKKELMLLEVLPKFSKFYSEEVFKSDSLANAAYEKEMKMTGSMNVKTTDRKGLVRNIVIKESPDFKTFLITRIGQSKLKVLDDRKFHWKILPEKEKIGEFYAQKAETEMYGRKWFAWFTTEIPIQDGPYKFHGLPGLIVKIEDQTKSHSYELKAVKKLSPEEIKNVDPKKNFVFDFGDNLEMDQAKFKKFFMESRIDPNKSVRAVLAQSEMAAINIDGKMMDVSEYLRNREKQQKEKIAKDNNIIELDLLK